MEIHVDKIEENKVQIFVPRNSMITVANFLLANLNYDLTNYDPNALEITTGSPYDLSTQETQYEGSFDCLIRDGNIEELLKQLSSNFQLRVYESDNYDWDLRAD